MAEAETTPELAPPDLGAAPTGVEVYVCPRCGGYYAASSAGDLSQKENRRGSLSNLAEDPPEKWGMVIGTRVRCQYCRGQGHDVDRLLVRYVRADEIQRLLDEAVEAAFQTEEKQSRVSLKRPDSAPAPTPGA